MSGDARSKSKIQKGKAHLNTHIPNASALRKISEETIQLWLIKQIASTTGLLHQQIDISEPFSSYGIDSVVAVALSAELANWLGQDIDPTITWDYPTVKMLARHLAANFVVPVAVAA